MTSCIILNELLQYRVEIINVDDRGQRGSTDNVSGVVHPSNMEVRTATHSQHTDISFTSALQCTYVQYTNTTCTYIYTHVRTYTCMHIYITVYLEILAVKKFGDSLQVGLLQIF